MGNTNLRFAPMAMLGTSRDSGSTSSRLAGFTSASDDTILSESVFDSMLTLERRRAQRSGKPFVLMLLDAHLGNGLGAGILGKAIQVALAATRETDLVGWYAKDSVFGVIFTEVSLTGKRSIEETLRERMESNLSKHLGRDRAAKIAISLHVFPESIGKSLSTPAAESKAYSRPKRAGLQEDISRVNKQMIDIPGTAALIFMLSPVLSALARIIRL